MARSAASRSAILRSRGTANGSSATGVSKRPWAGGRSSRRTGVRMAVALARAMRTASAATRSASAVVRWWLAAKPQAPPTMTRTPNPSLSPPATPSTRPDLMLIDSSSRRTTRTSAYVAPRAVAVSRARLVRSRIAAEGIARGEPARWTGALVRRSPATTWPSLVSPGVAHRALTARGASRNRHLHRRYTRDVAESPRGVFITLEGPDGSGKSSLMPRLAAVLAAGGCDVVATREPGSTPFGELMRRLVLDTDPPIDRGGRADALLFAASRAQHVDEVIRPGARPRRRGRVRPVRGLVAGLPGRGLRRADGPAAGGPALRDGRPRARPDDPPGPARRGGPAPQVGRDHPVRGVPGHGLPRAGARGVPRVRGGRAGSLRDRGRDRRAGRGACRGDRGRAARGRPVAVPRGGAGRCRRRAPRPPTRDRQPRSHPRGADGGVRPRHLDDRGAVRRRRRAPRAPRRAATRHRRRPAGTVRSPARDR